MDESRTSCKAILRVEIVPGIIFLGEQSFTANVSAVSRQQNPRELRHSTFAMPVTLQFAGELHPCRWLAPGLDKTVKASVVRLWRCPADGIEANGEC